MWKFLWNQGSSMASLSTFIFRSVAKGWLLGRFYATNILLCCEFFSLLIFGCYGVLHRWPYWVKAKWSYAQVIDDILVSKETYFRFHSGSSFNVSQWLFVYHQIKLIHWMHLPFRTWIQFAEKFNAVIFSH